MKRTQRKQAHNALRPAHVLSGFFLSAFVVFWLNGCATYPSVELDLEPVSLLNPSGAIPESLLLDVQIQVFNPGQLPASKNASRGLSMDIRRAEASYMAIELKNTMEKTGYWGRVRVVPSGTSGYELLVTGEIIKSNGEELHLKVAAVDATGRRWIKNKTYKSAVNAEMARKSTRKRHDMFEKVYYRIANDLVAQRQTLTAEQVPDIRQAAELRFAEVLAPLAFRRSLDGHTRNRFVTTAAMSPRMQNPESSKILSRVRQIRERENRLVDTLDGHYADMHGKMRDAYTNWRNLRLTEMNMIRDVDSKKSRQRTHSVVLLGVGIVLGNVLSNVDALDCLVAPVVGGISGAAATHFLNAEQIAEQAEYNKTMLEDLGISFAAEVEPTLLWLEGETIKLTGSVETKYHQWRAALEELYLVESKTDEPAEEVKERQSRISSRPDPFRPGPLEGSLSG